ncbi:hypothetical protein AN639_09645 [Candidatus Epulonipiscium fishelsonii]|uniref:Uncharacterized protein n=1 Tax=Candidatus Epulonipiscium fishelsonii TaxID=77094 RepID=A0ACC8XGJ1_9FIRM|nr:hypothetical protein AN639_09645 [Epulopiscium sp. SCG-B05WGA-EpuloA1]ONI42568.1 hypothetical protein AN396_14000 [Epulopiscium sp. SCG-B11WGA-EpuloA1]
MTKEINDLIQLLKNVADKLIQIQNITLNQSQILLSNEDEDNKVTLLEEMNRYKEELTGEMETIEKKFEERYFERRKGNIEKNVILVLQKNIQEILNLKKEVINLERTNVTIMQTKSKELLGPMKVIKNVNSAITAYKKFSKHSGSI